MIMYVQNLRQSTKLLEFGMVVENTIYFCISMLVMNFGNQKLKNTI